VTRIKEDRIAMYKDQEPLKAPLPLEEAMARGLKYNLDHRVKLMEDAISLRQVELMTFDMLPRVVAAAGYIERSNYDASSSTNVYTWEQSLAPSTSQEKGRYTGDLTMTWNILDFGVSYFQAKQQAERSHIMRERRRKVVHTIFQQIRQAYWQALGAQQLEGQFAPLLKEVNEALEDVRKIEAEKLRPPMETLAYKKTLLEIVKQLEGFRDELAQAKPRLAALINLPMGQDFSLVKPANLDIPVVVESLENMELRALAMRPELREVDYNQRISAHEVKKTILRMLPGAELTVGGHFDTNSYLVHQQWIDGSARLTWNLLNLLSGPTQYKIAKNQTELVKMQRMALSMAILTQVHVAHQEFENRRRQYELSDQLLTIDTQIHEQTAKQAKSGAESRLNEIKAATGSLMADYRRYQNYAALQNAYGQMTTTLGYDPLPETVTGHDLKTLTSEIKIRIEKAPLQPRPALAKAETPVAASLPAPLLTAEPVQAAAQAAPVTAAEEAAPVQAPAQAVPVTATEKTAPVQVPVAATVAPSGEKSVLETAVPEEAVPGKQTLANPKFEKLKAMAEAGDAAAQRRMGWHYSSGTVVEVNKAEALRWYEKAAANGDLEAQLAVGWIYYTGNGVAADLARSAQWYGKAARQGNRKAAIMLKKLEQANNSAGGGV